MPTASFDIDYAARQLFRHFLDEWRARPTLPPLLPLLGGLGLTDTVTQRSEAYRVLQPPAFVNQYAAMPSLHAGWDLLVGIAIVAATTSTLWLTRRCTT